MGDVGRELPTEGNVTERSTAWRLRRGGGEEPLFSGEGPRLATRPCRFGSEVLLPPDEEEEDEMMRSQGSLEEGEWSDLAVLRRGGLEFPEDLFLENNGDEVEEEDDYEEEDEKDVELYITEHHAKWNYNIAGSKMSVEEDSIKIEDFQDFITMRAEAALDEVDSRLGLPYETAPFQRIAINAAVEHKNVVLVKECGSGKLDVALKGSLVMRITERELKGLTIVLQPLSNLQNEKLSNNIAKVAVLSMGQSISVLGEDVEGKKAVLSCTLEEVLSGKYSVLLAHPESFATSLGQQILVALQRTNLLLLIVIDEVHQGCEGHWDSFRPDMLRLSCGLRVYARKNAPVIAMTATAKEDEIKQVISMLGLREEPVLIWSCPVQKYHKFSILKRPANCRGLLGTVDKLGRLQPGLWHLLERLYVGEFLLAVKEGRRAKRCIIYFRNNVVMGAFYTLLQKLTGQTNPSTADFAMNHSSLLPPDDRMLDLRRDDITMYGASNKMLLGTNLKNIDLVIFAQPFDMEAALLQGAGRMSRRTIYDFRTVGQVYLLYNGSDLSLANKGMSKGVRQLCRSSEMVCTKAELKKLFAVDNRVFRKQASAEASSLMEEENTVAEAEEQDEEASFQELQRKMASCRNPADMCRLLQRNAELSRMFAESVRIFEPEVEAVAESQERGEENYCCHYHDLLG